MRPNALPVVDLRVCWCGPAEGSRKPGRRRFGVPPGRKTPCREPAYGAAKLALLRTRGPNCKITAVERRKARRFERNAMRHVIRIRHAVAETHDVTVRRPALHSPHLRGEKRLRRARAGNNRADVARLYQRVRTSSPQGKGGRASLDRLEHPVRKLE